VITARANMLDEDGWRNPDDSWPDFEEEDDDKVFQINVIKDETCAD
jgi:hypothetical protein